MGRLNARQARKKILAITGLFAMGAMLMLPIFTALPALAGGGGAKGGPPPEVLAAQKAAAEAASRKAAEEEAYQRGFKASEEAAEDGDEKNENEIG